MPKKNHATYARIQNMKRINLQRLQGQMNDEKCEIAHLFVSNMTPDAFKP
jgi:hypothetical protein